MKFNLIVGVVLLAVAVSAFDVGTNDTNSLFIHGTKRQRSAAELKEYHQRKRAEAVKMHKNYEVTFPEDPVSTFVFIGESEKAFIVAIESGSDDFWILDVSYPNPGSYATVYDPFNFTSVELGDFYAESANLRLEGKKYADNVTFGNPINQTFGSVTNIYGEWNDPQFYDDISGSFGLSWNPALKDEPVTADSAPILNVFASLDPCPRVFGQLTSQFPENGTMAGSLTVFGVNLNHWCHPSPVAALPLSYDEESKQMTFKLDSFAFGSQKIEGDLAKVDTGSSAIYLPWEAFEIIFASLVPTFDYEIGVYTIDCNDRGHLDDFVFTVAGAELRVSSTSYVFDLGLEDNQCVLGIFYSSIASSTSYSLGVPFLYEYAVEWSIDDSTITFKNYLPFPTAAPKVDARI